MTEGYTRGAWEYVPGTEHHGPYVTTEWGSDVCDCYIMGNLAGSNYPINFQGKEAEANARLIAAAPELLEALKATLEEIERVEADVEYKLPCGDKARAAITKAEGSAP